MFVVGGNIALVQLKDIDKKIIYVAIGNRKMVSHYLKNVASRTFYITENFISDAAAAGVYFPHCFTFVVLPRILSAA